MKAYPKDLRQKIVDAIERGMPKAEAARTFGVGISTVKRYVTKAQKGEPLEPGKAPGKRPKMDERLRKLLEEDLNERPFVTLRERCDYIDRGHKRSFGEPFHHVPRHSSDRFHAQKGGPSATERDEFLRSTWRVMVAAEVAPERLVFVDEMGVHTSLAPLYGYSRKGERVHLQVPRNRGKNTTLLASMTLSGMGETLAVEGSTNKAVFEAYIERALAPTLKAGQVVILDNLSAHKPARVRELIESRGCELVYLPAYSPRSEEHTSELQSRQYLVCRLLL